MSYFSFTLLSKAHVAISSVSELCLKEVKNKYFTHEPSQQNITMHLKFSKKKSCKLEVGQK